MPMSYRLQYKKETSRMLVVASLRERNFFFIIHFAHTTFAAKKKCFPVEGFARKIDNDHDVGIIPLFGIQSFCEKKISSRKNL